MKERFEQLRAMGIRAVMITGDNPLTAAAIAREAGVDDFLAEAKPKDKMDLIKREQADGKLVAMTGDGTNDAPALAAADVGMAISGGMDAASEAASVILLGDRLGQVGGTTPTKDICNCWLLLTGVSRSLCFHSFTLEKGHTDC